MAAAHFHSHFLFFIRHKKIQRGILKKERRRREIKREEENVIK